MSHAVNAIAAVLLWGALAPAGATTAAPAGDLWETQVTMKTAEHGEMALPAQRHCQPVAARNLQALLPQLGEQCPGLQLRPQGDRVTWSGPCHQGRSEGELRYLGNGRMSGHMSMTAAGTSMEMRFEGRRLGRCKPGVP